MDNLRILVTGGRGRLARELVMLDSAIDAPDRGQLDFSRYDQVESYCGKKKYDVIIHAGALTNKLTPGLDEQFILSNIIGTSNVVLWAMRNDVRLIYLSSDYVYPSECGDYTEESVLFPVNRYAKSKLGGEMAVQLYDKSLIVRMSFYGELNFAKGCVDQFVSRLPVREAAKAVYTLAVDQHIVGVINVGTRSKRSVFEIINGEFNSSVEPCTRSDLRIPYIAPPDSSLNSSKYNRLVESRLENSKNQVQCRICHSTELYKYLDLGRVPLANSYLSKEQLSTLEFVEELALQLCVNCGLSQLTKVVSPDMMFKNYLYVSSTTQTFQNHCVELAGVASEIVRAGPNDLALDIASNDGCLLSKFRSLGMKVLGVDPAENLAAEANASGIRTLCAYWSPALAKDIVSRFGSPRIITATNVFAHVDDVHAFVDAVDLCLARRGIFVIEFPYVVDFIERNEFDTAYHEHLSYIGIHPVVHLMRTHGMEVFDVVHFPSIHGGTVRIFVCRAGDYEVSENVGIFLRREDGFGLKNKSTYELFAKRVLENKRKLGELIKGLLDQGKTIWAYGASAKGNTLTNFFEITNAMIPIVVDDNPKKSGFYTPGSKMRITEIGELPNANVDYLLLLAWNFQAEIMKRCRAVNYVGGFILPVPEPTVIHKEN